MLFNSSVSRLVVGGQRRRLWQVTREPPAAPGWSLTDGVFSFSLLHWRQTGDGADRRGRVCVSLPCPVPCVVIPSIWNSSEWSLETESHATATGVMGERRGPACRGFGAVTCTFAVAGRVCMDETSFALGSCKATRCHVSGCQSLGLVVGGAGCWHCVNSDSYTLTSVGGGRQRSVASRPDGANWRLGLQP